MNDLRKETGKIEIEKPAVFHIFPKKSPWGI
jgi:hypothetical protein